MVEGDGQVVEGLGGVLLRFGLDDGADFGVGGEGLREEAREGEAVKDGGCVEGAVGVVVLVWDGGFVDLGRRGRS